MNGSTCSSRRPIVDDSGVPGFLWSFELVALKKAAIDVTQLVVRIEYVDGSHTVHSETLALAEGEIAALNRGGSLVLRDKLGKQFVLTV